MRLVTADAEPIGPGKVALLEAIGRTGSISAAARAHGMSYGRAWKLVNEVNEAFRAPLVTTATGGVAGGGASLSEPAMRLIALYRETEEATRRDAERRLQPLLDALAKGAAEPAER
jgi:molybdate transport system regulatory protein